jgi:hypothetical protein
MKATLTGPGTKGKLKPIENCYVIITGPSSKERKITFNNLPDISDTKSASYTDETVIGRGSPVKTYSQSDNRAINVTIHFLAVDKTDLEENLKSLRAIQSAVYPREGEGGAPFIPPPVCKIKCGKLLSDNEELCVLLKSYSVKFPTDTSWNAESYIPYKFDVDTSWEVVYSSAELPGQEKIYSF